MQATIMGRGGHPVAELAWVIGASHQGQGFAKEAAALAVCWLNRCGVVCLSAHIHPAHHASMAVARSVGLLPTDVVENGEVRWERAGPADSRP